MDLRFNSNQLGIIKEPIPGFYAQTDRDNELQEAGKRLLQWHLNHRTPEDNYDSYPEVQQRRFCIILGFASY